jgi:hypothetical protein
MKITYYFLFIILFSAALFAQNYPDVTIRDIQFVHDTSLAAGVDKSVRVGDTVRVIGVVMIPSLVDPTFDRRPLMWAGARWQTYLRDTSYSNNEWAGLNVIQDDTTSIITNMDLLDSAQVVRITGVVSEFVSSGYTNGQTQINVLRTESVQFLGSKPNRGEAYEIQLSELNNGSLANMLTGEKYEGQYVMIRDVTTSDRNTTTGTFYINDAFGNKLHIHDQSGYFTKRSHKLREFDPPIDGTSVKYIRGVIGHYSNPNMYVIRPMLPNDMLIGQSPPSISGVRRNTDLILPGQAVNVSATIVDMDSAGYVAEAKINYRINGGALTIANMTLGLGNVWSGTIPGVSSDSALVEFYITALDNDGMISSNPVDIIKNKYFYLVLNRPLTVQDVQYSPFGGGFSGYNNYRVTVSGVVTADTSDLQGDGNQVSRRVYIQNGQGPWSGIWVFGSSSDQLVRGQHITVSGLIREDNSNTRVDSVTQIVVNSSGNPLPDAELIYTRKIATTSTVPNGYIDAEQWEGVLVKYADVTVTDDNADGNSGPGGGGNSNFGEITVCDTSNISTRVELQEGNHEYHNLWAAELEGTGIRLNQGDKFTELRGVMFYSFSNYKIVPRKSDDFVGYTSDVREAVSPAEYRLSQNYPNPFNPSTIIEYTVPVGGYITLNVYNILGELVKTLVNMDQNAGSYKVIFNANSLPSGIYFYEIRTDNFKQSKKMLLVK